MEAINSYEELQGLINDEKILIVYFGSNSCSVCVSIKPRLENLFTKYEKVKSIHIDVEKSLLIAGQHNIFTIPTVLLFIDGKETLRESRFIGVDSLNDKISRYYHMIFDNEWKPFYG